MGRPMNVRDMPGGVDDFKKFVKCVLIFQIMQYFFMMNSGQARGQS